MARPRIAGAGKAPGKPAGQRVEAVERALSILEAFSDGTARLSLSAISARTGLYPSTVLRLAASLDRFGYLHRDAGGEFRLGPALWRLGVLYQADFNLADHVRPVLAALVETTGETACFYVREKDRRICLYRLNGPRMVRSHLDEGAQLPLDRGAAGHVLTAFTERAEDLDERLAGVRARGYAVSIGERDPDSTALAVPVFRTGGVLVGALGVVGPRSRMDEGVRREVLSVLIRNASALSRRLGAT